MATQLPAAITVTNSEGMSGSATHEQWGATVQPWNTASPVVAYLAAGNVDADGNFKPMNGVRSDTGEVSPQYINLDAYDFAQLTVTPEWIDGLTNLVALCRYLDADRDPALKPAWYTEG